jgi:predicted small lipoprotein YifL
MTQSPHRLACLALVLVLAAVIAPLAACGKKGAPAPPASEPNTYPRSYPRE